MKLIPTITLALFAATAGLTKAATVLTENFTYVDGALVTVSSGAWATHSGTALQVNVASNAAFLTSAESEDVNTRIAPAGFGFNAGTLTARTEVNFSALPVGAGAYFFHFKDSSSGFRGRVYATVNGAAAGSFRLGIANSSSSVFTSLATDLVLGTPYSISLSLNVVTGVAGLSINGGAITLASDPTDLAQPIVVEAIAFRQSLATGNGMGSLTADSLTVDATVPAVAVPEASSVVMMLLTGLGLLRRRR